MKGILFIGLGGFLGSIARYLVYLTVKSSTSYTFIGTFLVNILGCFLIGILSNQMAKLGNDSRLFLTTGFCGGFTTFSTFALENTALLKDGVNMISLVYIGSSVLVGILSCILGIYLSQKF